MTNQYFSQPLGHPFRHLLLLLALLGPLTLAWTQQTVRGPVTDETNVAQPGATVQRSPSA